MSNFTKQGILRAYRFNKKVKGILRYIFLAMTKDHFHLDIEASYLLLVVCSTYSKFKSFSHATGTGNIMIVAAAELARIEYTKLQKFSSLLNLKIPQKTSFYEHHQQFVFPEIDAAWQNQLEQIKEINSSGRMLELALDGQCDSPGDYVTYNTVSAIDTATNKLINFRVVHVKVCNYLNETSHCVSFCDFCILRAQSQRHNIYTTLKPNGNCDIYTETLMF